jgi:peptidoglycan/LPS O-acetylase OafA/YrhL
MSPARESSPGRSVGKSILNKARDNLTPALSLYLDVLRFTAAFLVFISHYAPGYRSGGLFWQIAGYGRASVLAFFVLSGFVIAWVAQGKEANLQEYALSRISRLYSVIIPALIMTAILDSVGTSISPTLYQHNAGMDADNSIIHYILSILFLGQSWTLKVVPGSDLPFWSLNYEAWYYIMYACFIFFSGKRRLLLLLAAALLAGPKILAFFPIWLMGVAAWQLKDSISPRLGAVLALGAVASLVGLEISGGQKLFTLVHTPWLPFDFSAYDYIIGLGVAMLICGIAKARLPMPGKRMTGAVHVLAGTTFGLYLFHYPLLNFFGTVFPGEPASLLHRVLLFTFTLGASLALAALVERRKSTLKHFLRSALNMAGPITRDVVMRKTNRRFTG